MTTHVCLQALLDVESSIDINPIMRLDGFTNLQSFLPAWNLLQGRL